MSQKTPEKEARWKKSSELVCNSRLGLLLVLFVLAEDRRHPPVSVTCSRFCQLLCSCKQDRGREMNSLQSKHHSLIRSYLPLGLQRVGLLGHRQSCLSWSPGP